MAKSKKGRNHIQGDGVKLFEMRWYKNKNVVIKHCPFRIFNRISCETIVIYCIILNSFFFFFLPNHPPSSSVSHILKFYLCWGRLRLGPAGTASSARLSGSLETSSSKFITRRWLAGQNWMWPPDCNRNDRRTGQDLRRGRKSVVGKRNDEG